MSFRFGNISYRTTQQNVKINIGIEDNPKSHRQPNVGITNNANMVSKQAPIAQND